MRTLIAALLLIPLLAACGDDEDETTESAAPQPREVTTLVLTSAGGKVDPAVTWTDDRKALKGYLRTFDDRDDVADAIRQAVTDAGEREGRLAVATVGIGCDSPEGVTIVEGEQGWEVTAGKVVDQKKECFAPMTTIAVVEIPDA